MGHNSYKQFRDWTQTTSQLGYPLSEVAWIEELHASNVDEQQHAEGILADQKVRLGRPSPLHLHHQQLQDEGRTIAAIYQKRWQIELLFKRIKKHYPLRYFLADTERH